MSTVEELANKIVELEKELKGAKDRRHIIRQESLTLGREILEKRFKLKDIEIALDKAGHVVSQLESDLRVAKDLFWRAKG